jgi:hypothetical protein
MLVIYTGPSRRGCRDFPRANCRVPHSSAVGCSAFTKFRISNARAIVRVLVRLPKHASTSALLSHSTASGIPSIRLRTPERISLVVIPAKAGIHCPSVNDRNLDPRVRGDDSGEILRPNRLLWQTDSISDNRYNESDLQQRFPTVELWGTRPVLTVPQASPDEGGRVEKV